MKNHISSLFRLAIVSLAAFPAFALAAPTAGTPYYNDVTNSYVQDQTSKAMSELNNILCFMAAMAPDQMVNLTTNNGNYIALVDQNVCESNGGGGQSSNTGPAYTPVVVNSARATNTDPMLVKAWLGFPQKNEKITVYASATQAPTTALPYGLFRMDFCGTQTGGAACASGKGFIAATSDGLAFYQGGIDGMMGPHSTALQLNKTSSTTGQGKLAIDQNGAPSAFAFAFDANYFVRSDGVNPNRCFSRDPLQADESVWRYGLYHATSGARITRNSGFPIEYTDTSVTPNVTANGYIGYYGMWTQGTGPASGATVNQVTYNSAGATKTSYTLLKTGGKLMKYTTATKTLAQLDKITFWYYAQYAVGNVMNAGSQYELYWDNTARNFMVSGKQGTSNNMEPYPTPVAVLNSDMLAANTWGLFGWSQMMGGMFGITGSDFANLTSTVPSTVSAIPVKTQTQDIVYPSQFASITGGLKCINDCPTAALIAESNGTGPSTTPYTNPGWQPVSQTSFKTYTLNGATGNLVDAASGVVVSTATTGINANGVRSGRMVTPADETAMINAKNASGVCGTGCTTFNQGDVDFLPVGSSYFVWETGGQPWNQIALLMDASNVAVLFEAPLQVNFVVPSNTAKYGSYAGATISLQYGGFGDLWGIPNECIDIATNTACVFGTGGTAQNNQRWASKFSIPFDATVGVVTADAGATTYFVKPLDKEVRLKNVALSACGTLAPPTTGVTPPDVSGWLNPTASAGPKPIFNPVPAPQVIHGVKQY